ncbi:MAG: phosphoglycerate dehydrogenase [Dietzia sp.]|uniref:D-3-phosphoglycerate dehydrogenase n=1 Tax=Dietzia cercidiphylli TaxID=498199 RepID=A0ABP4U6B1_9ACTN|nr:MULTISPECIES: phosphoglycerate dehydrogenase [Dietzia]MBB1037814.1 phosphoglycerate dehydrogenase [Dietzia natronolimnaea]MBB1049893.1 phosphoglycerate dehydrogenase [Dietzia sp. CW19]MBB1055149.1 phosphoglycerate dehydrogenase [Dietzia sp. B44]MBB1056503.1 phosphoglycerate dehydrogenase [Dietzia sp. B19]MBB1047893.1 phosphoglycerate dehydrogenase [Dietzia cercidiphylli]
MTASGRPVVLIADKLAQSTVDALGDAVEVRWVDGPDRPKLLEAVADADAILVRSATTVDAEVMAAAPKLKIIGRAGVGLDNVEIPAATERGVMVVNAPTSNIHSAAEHAVALLMAACRQIPAADRTLREHTWKRSSFNGVELLGKTVGVVGLGRIGQLVAQRLAAFETNLIAYDPYLPAARAAQLGIELVDIDELVSRADIITMHLPKTKETAGLLDAERLARAKDGVVIVNAARGGLIVEDALVEALRSGKVRSAALDVFDTEPCTDSPLFDLENTVVTPHLGASTSEAQDRAGTDVARSVLLALRGEFVPDAVNVTGGPVGDEVAPWLDLVRKLGLIAGHLCPGVPTTVTVEVAGELAAEQVDVLGLAALRGMFSAITDEPATFVNVGQMAEQRGVTHSVETRSESKSYRSTVTVTAVAADGASAHVTGTLAGLDQVQKIVRINERGFDMRAEGQNLFVHYSDRPGVLGKVGSILGGEGIDIQAAALSQDVTGEGASLILRVDRAVAEPTVDRIVSELDATATQISLV